MKVVLMDTGRRRAASDVEAWVDRLGLSGEDEVALISWLPPAEALPVVDQMVFGPRLEWLRREPVRPPVARERRVPLPPDPWGLPRSDPRRWRAAVARRVRRVDASLVRRSRPLLACVPGGMTSPWDLVSSGRSPLARRLRRAVGVRTDGFATDFAVAVARSRDAAELVAWSDVVVPVDTRSRKAAWMLARRVAGPLVTIDLASGGRAVALVREVSGGGR